MATIIAGSRLLAQRFMQSKLAKYVDNNRLILANSSWACSAATATVY